MASDKLHLSKKWNTVFIHLAAWSILFIFPLLFIERFGNINRMHNFSLIKFYIQPICIACIFYINYLWLIDKVLFRKKTIRFILYNLLLVVMANIAIYLVHRMVIPESILHQRPTPIPPPRPGFMQWQDSITLVLVVGLSAAIKVTQKWITTEKERKQLEQERTEAELKNLKNQLNPHFLFNTISTIVSLVRTETDKARSLLIDFSNYYRQTLSDSDTLTTLEHEVEQGTRYINLMQARYGDGRLRVSVDIDFEVRDSLVPPFILQPLLENCIKHAQRETEPLSIHVRAFETDDGLEIIVEDDGIGMSEEVCAHLFEQHRREEPESITADGSVKRGCGLALFNVLQRIHFFYGEDSGMRVKSQEGVGTQVIVELNGEPHEPAPLTA